MYNSLIALGIALVTFLLGFLAAGWVAGILPALLAGGVAWALLARRTGRQLEPLMRLAGEQAQAQKLDEAKATLESALPLADWQFLVKEQVHTQLGSLAYLQAVMLIVQQQKTQAPPVLQKAREHFEIASPSGWRSYLLGWQPRAMLACVLHRQGDTEGAIKLCESAARSPRTEAVFWGLYAWLLNEQKRRDEALVVLAQGLKEHAGSKPLTEMRDALSNKKRPEMIVFGEVWYQFFPEDMRYDPKVIELARAQQQRQFEGQQRRGPPPKTWPQPRR